MYLYPKFRCQFYPSRIYSYSSERRCRTLSHFVIAPWRNEGLAPNGQVVHCDPRIHNQYTCTGRNKDLDEEKCDWDW